LAPQLLILGVPTAAVTVVLSLRMLGDRAAPEPHDAPEGAKTRVLSATVLLLGAIAFASMLCEGAAADWSSVYLRDSAAGSAAIAGLGYTVFALAMMFVRMSGDRLLARFGARRVIPLLAAVAAAALAAALAIGAVATALAAFFLLGLGLGSVVPTTFSAAGRIPGIHPGRSVAGVSGLGWAGFVCGPPVIGQLAAGTSLPIALGLVPLLCAFIAVASWRVTAMHG
jgi:fucose permease